MAPMLENRVEAVRSLSRNQMYLHVYACSPVASSEFRYGTWGS